MVDTELIRYLEKIRKENCKSDEDINLQVSLNDLSSIILALKISKASDDALNEELKILTHNLTE